MLFAAVAHVLERCRCLQPLAATRSAEASELTRSPLVAVDEVIEFELIDLAGVELGEAAADVLKECSQLLLLVGATIARASRRFAFSLEAPAT